MATTGSTDDAAKKEADSRAKQHERDARTKAFYDAWRKQNAVLSWRILGKESEPDPATLKETMVGRGYPNDPMEPMPVGFLRRQGVGTGRFDTTYSDMLSDGKSLTSFNRDTLLIKASNIEADIKNQQDCWAKHGVGAIQLDNKVPNGNVLQGITDRLEKMLGIQKPSFSERLKGALGFETKEIKPEHPPRAIHLGPHIIKFIHSDREMSNGKVSAKWERLMQLANQSQLQYAAYMDSKVSKNEAKDTIKNYKETVEKYNDPAKCPPAPVGAAAADAMVNGVLAGAADPNAKLAKIAPEIEKLEKRAEELAKDRKQLTDQMEKFDAIIKKGVDDPDPKAPKATYAEVNGVGMQIARESEARAALLAGMDREQAQIDGLRQVWQRELQKPEYPVAHPPQVKGVADNLREKLQVVDDRAKPAPGAASADIRTKYQDIAVKASTKAAELEAGGATVAPRKPR